MITRRKSLGLLVVALAAAGLLIALSGWDRFETDARGQISEVTCESEVGMVNNAPDAGITVRAAMKNTAGAGPLKVEATLSSSEGEWTRSQMVEMKAGEEIALRYFFGEPSVNATDVRCGVTALPAA